MGFYDYAYEIIEVIKKRQNIVYENWEIEDSMFYWEKYCSVMENYEQFCYYYPANIQLQHTTSSNGSLMLKVDQDSPIKVNIDS